MCSIAKCILSTLGLFILSNLPAYAKEGSPPRFQFVSSVVYTVNTVSGPTPPAISHGVGIIVPLDAGWGYYIEGSASTSTSELHPGFMVLTGPTKKISGHLTLGASGFYKIVPSYVEGGGATNIIGGYVTPIIPTEFGSISFPLGIAGTVSAPGVTGIVTVKLAIR